MAGFWFQSNTQIHDQNGKPRIGAKAYFYKGGTTTPITVYKSFDLGAINAHPNPIQTDGNGYWPPVYFDEADQFYRVRITTSLGVLIVDADGIPIIGPAAGGGGGSVTPIDPDAVFKTGDLKDRYGEGFVSGWVRCNGRTVGSSTSGATERANSDTRALFEFLWGEDPNLAVAGGRGASAAADWSANKWITLPDMRGRTRIGSDVMGNTAANVIGAASALGWTGGAGTHVLTIAEMPSHNHTGETSEAGQHDHDYQFDNGAPGNEQPQSGLRGTQLRKTSTVPAHRHAIPAEGGGAAHNNIQPSMAVTIYIRL